MKLISFFKRLRLNKNWYFFPSRWQPWLRRSRFHRLQPQWWCLPWSSEIWMRRACTTCFLKTWLDSLKKSKILHLVQIRKLIPTLTLFDIVIDLWSVFQEIPNEVEWPPMLGLLLNWALLDPQAQVWRWCHHKWKLFLSGCNAEQENM